MKAILVALLLSLSFAAQAQNAVDSVSLGTDLATKIINFFDTKPGSGIAGGTYQGEDVYGAEIECSNPVGSNNAATMTCYVRAMAGFSHADAAKSAPIKLNADITGLLTYEMAKANFNTLIGHGFQALAATLICERDSGSGENRPDHCTLSKIKI